MTFEEFLTKRRREVGSSYRLPPGYRWDGSKVVATSGANPSGNLGQPPVVPLGGVGGMPGTGGSGQINIPIGGVGGEHGGTPTIGSGPGYVDGLPGGTLPGSPVGWPTAPQAPQAPGASGMSRALRKAAPLIAPALSLLASRGGGGNSGEVPMQNELTGLLNMQRSRMEQANPLYEAVLRMAMGLLPAGARSSMPGQQAPAQSTAAGPMPMGRTRSRG